MLKVGHLVGQNINAQKAEGAQYFGGVGIAPSAQNISFIWNM